MSTAFELFSTTGIADTTISDITSKAGIGKGTFYSYFKDKYDIHDHIVAAKAVQLFDNAIQTLNDPFSMPLEDLYIRIVDNIIDQLTVDKNLLKFIYKNLSMGVFNTVLDESTGSTNTKVSELFDSAFDHSAVKYKDPYVMTYIIIEMTSGTIYNVILKNEPMSIEQFKPVLYDHIRAILKLNEIKQ